MNIATYESLLEDEYRASGRLPRVAVIGCDDFDSLCGELMTMFGYMLTVPTELPDRHEFGGVILFKSYANKHGVWFGGSKI